MPNSVWECSFLLWKLIPSPHHVCVQTYTHGGLALMIKEGSHQQLPAVVLRLRCNFIKLVEIGLRSRPALSLREVEERWNTCFENRVWASVCILGWEAAFVYFLVREFMRPSIWIPISVIFRSFLFKRLYLYLSSGFQTFWLKKFGHGWLFYLFFLLHFLN